MMEGLQDIDEAAHEVYVCREEVIRCLEEVADELDKQKRNVHISNTSFASVGVVGGAATLAGLVFAPFTAGLSLALTAGGVGLAATSLAGGVGTKITDTILKNKKVKRAKEAIERYNKSVLELGNKIDALNENTKNDLALVIDVVKTDQKDLLKLTDMSTQILKTGAELVKVLDCTKGVGVANTLAKELVEGSKLLIKSLKPGSLGTAARGSFQCLLKTGKLVGTAFCVLNIGFDVAAIIHNSLAIHKKAPHEVAEKLREIIKDIKGEDDSNKPLTET